jgi:2-polyprenyl-6-methoxyphenol hydroxylase-like FAD-dependent oxidoreductase
MHGTSEELETTDILICGGGPTGALLSALLGQLRIFNVVLEREPEITTDPRGIALDEDGIRMLQAIGVYDQIYTEIGSCRSDELSCRVFTETIPGMNRFNFVGGVHNDLSTKAFMSIDYGTTEGGTGHVGFICHKQPVLEKAIRAAIAENEFSELRVGSTIVSITEDRDFVQVEYASTNGTRRKMRAKFLVGADGKTGYTRKKYLEPKGIIMEQCSQSVDPFQAPPLSNNSWSITGHHTKRRGSH